MTYARIARLAAVVTLCLAAALPSPSLAYHGYRYGGRHAARFHCGRELWSIKTLTDPGASSIPTTIVPTTIHTLVAFSPPPNLGYNMPRTGKLEHTIWSVEARLIGWKEEQDEDYHLVLHDPSTGQSMIAEIPNQICSSWSGAYLFARSRATVNDIGGHRTAGGWHWLDWRGATPPLVRITGVGFWDMPHDIGQVGHDPNNVEIHPVVDVTILR
jgi:hypothetical protein